MASERLGIAGAGRLGGALAVRLAGAGHAVLVHDRDAGAARAVAGRGIRRTADPGRLVARCGAVLLCLPTPEVAPFLSAHGPAARPGTLFLNLATSLPTAELRAAVPGLRLAGLKPVGQFRAIRLGLPTLFVTEPEAAVELAALRALVAPLGTVIVADEAAVGRLNRLATSWALDLCLRLTRHAGDLEAGPQLAVSALHSLVFGTMLDSPPAPDNEYALSLPRRP